MMKNRDRHSKPQRKVGESTVKRGCLIRMIEDAEYRNEARQGWVS